MRSSRSKKGIFYNDEFKIRSKRAGSFRTKPSSPQRKTPSCGYNKGLNDCFAHSATLRETPFCFGFGLPGSGVSTDITYSTFTPIAISVFRSDLILSRSSAAVSKSNSFAAARISFSSRAINCGMFTVGRYSPASSAAIGTVK